MRQVEGHLGFTIGIDDELRVKLNDPRICEALEAAVHEAPIAMWSKDGKIHVAELYASVPADTPDYINDTFMWLDRNTATFGVASSLTEALRWMLGHFWVKTEDQP